MQSFKPSHEQHLSTIDSETIVLQYASNSVTVAVQVDAPVFVGNQINFIVHVELYCINITSWSRPS